MIGNDLDDEFRGNFLFVARRNDVFQCFFSQFNVNFTVFLQLGKGNDLGECALQLTDIGLDVGGNVLDYFVIYIVTFHFLFFAEDGHSGFVVRGLDIYGQTPFESGAQPFFQCFNLFRRFIGRNDDLFFGFVKCIEGVEKFFLGTFLADDELDIID